MTEILKLRLKFTKDGDMRWLSQLDISRTMVRALRRAKIPIMFTSGFSPHPKISFGPALALGIGSEAEYCDVFLGTAISGEEALGRLRRNLPESLAVTDAAVMNGSPSLGKIIKKAAYRINGAIDSKAIDDQVTSGRFLLTIEGNKINSDAGIEEKIELRRVSYRDSLFEADVVAPINVRPRSIMEAIESRAEAKFLSSEISRIAQIAVIDGLETDPLAVATGGAIVETAK